MAPRAQWKGYLKIDEIGCAVALYSAATTSERTSFHTVNKEDRQPGQARLRRRKDRKAGRPRRPGQGLMKPTRASTSSSSRMRWQPSCPESDKTLRVRAFHPLQRGRHGLFRQALLHRPRRRGRRGRLSAHSRRAEEEERGGTGPSAVPPPAPSDAAPPWRRHRRQHAQF